ncbi:unnamed protein product [Agarophyton chilense]
MVAVLANDAILSVLRAARREADLHTTDGVQTISHARLAAATRLVVTTTTTTNPSLRALLRHTQLFLTHAHACDVLRAPSAPNAALQRRVLRLREAQRAREYERMVRDVAPRNDAGGERVRLGRVGAQMAVVTNVVVTMGTCFTAGYFVFSRGAGSRAAGLAGGLAAMVLGLCVEAVLVVTRLYAIDKEALRTEARRHRPRDPRPD